VEYKNKRADQVYVETVSCDLRRTWVCCQQLCMSSMSPEEQVTADDDDGWQLYIFKSFSHYYDNKVYLSGY